MLTSLRSIETLKYDVTTYTSKRRNVRLASPAGAAVVAPVVFAGRPVERTDTQFAGQGADSSV
jgi:hypothetical protein